MQSTQKYEDTSYDKTKPNDQRLWRSKQNDSMQTPLWSDTDSADSEWGSVASWQFGLSSPNYQGVIIKQPSSRHWRYNTDV